jgi:catechol 2,3-dioxygenase-like lactoylglutathione lyase family enzyme
MISLTQVTADESESGTSGLGAVAAQPKCYAFTVFTQQFREVRDFYVDILGASVVTERPGKVCELELGGMPLCLRQAEHGEMVSYFHLHLAIRNPEAVLAELRRRGIIVTSVGPFTNFRDPEGRVVKLSDQRVSL